MYGGTKSEMDRLIMDAMKLDKTFKVATKTTGNGKKANKELAYSYADIVQAIHIVQNEMGITGTTAKEAEKTISGSLNMMKAAWQNLLTGLGEGSDEKVDMLVEQLIYSAEKVLDNMLPVIEKVLYGIVTMIEGLAPVIADKLPAFVERILPPLTKATATLVKAFTKALIQNMPVIIQCAIDILKEVFKAIQEEAPALIPIIFTVLGAKIIGTATSLATTVSTLAAKFGLTATAATATTTAVEGSATAMTFAQTSAVSLTGVLSKLGTVALAAADAIMLAYDYQTLKDAYEGYKEANQAYNSEIETALDNYVNLYNTKGKEVADEWAQMVYQLDTTGMSMEQAQTALSNKISGLWDGVPRNMWEGFRAGWNDYFGADGKGLLALLSDAFTGAVNGVKRLLGISSPSTVFENIGINIMQGLYNGIMSLRNRVISLIQDIANRVANAVKGVFRIGSPSKLMEEYGKYIDEGLAQGISKNSSMPVTALNQVSGSMVGNSSAQTFSVSRGAPAQQQTQINLILDNTVIGRALLPYINAEQSRVGVQLVGGAL